MPASTRKFNDDDNAGGKIQSLTEIIEAPQTKRKQIQSGFIVDQH